MAKSVIGLFENTGDAQAALGDLESAGFSGNNVTYVTTANSQLVSALTSAGIPQEDATLYANGVQQGGGLIILQALPDAEANRAVEILDRHNTVDISGRGQGFQQSTTSSVSTGMTASTGSRRSSAYEGGEAVIPIIEEEIRVGKREVESGGVRVQTRVEEVPVNEQVTLREETVDVQRRRVDRPVTDADLTAVQQGSFEVRERDEQAIVEKEARVVEEVVINKDVQQRTETIQDTVRRTDIDVEQVPGQTRVVGETDLSGGSSGSTSGR